MGSTDTPPKPSRPPAAAGPSGPPPPEGAPPRPGPAVPGRLLVAVLAVAVLVVAVLALAGHTQGGHHEDAGGAGAGFSPGAAVPVAPDVYQVRAGDVGLVVLDGVSGRVQVSADPGADAVTGSFRPAGDAGAASMARAALVHDAASGTDAMTLACTDTAGGRVPCAGDLVLRVPQHTGLRLRQTSGEITLNGLGGDLVLDASSVRVTASALRPVRARLALTSGSADLAFAAVPDDVDLRETSASMAVRLPHSPDGYAVTTSASSASAQVAVDRNAASAHRISLSVTSGSLDVSDAGGAAAAG